MTVSNIAADIQQPNMLGMAGNIVNLANAGQQFQQQQIQTATMQQANEERQRVNTLLQQHPEWINPDGTFKMDKAAPAIMAVAPQTGQEKIAKITDTNNRMTNANQAVLNLGKDNAQQVNQQLYAMKGLDPSDRAPIIDAMESQFPTTKPLWEQYRHMLGVIQGSATNPAATGYDQKAAMQKFDGYWTQFAKNQQEQQAQNQGEAPKYATQQFGNKVQVTQTNANAPGGVTGPLNPTGTVSAGIQPQLITDALGRPVPYEGTAGGINQAANITQPPVTNVQAPSRANLGTPITAKQSGVVVPPPLPAYADKPTADRVMQYQDKWQKAQAANADATTGYQNTMQIYKNLNELLKQNPNIGPQSAKWNQISGYLPGGGTNAGYQEVAAYLDSLAQARANNVGATTNMGREQAAGAVGSPTYVRDALQEKVRFGAATSEAGNAYTTAASNFQRKYGNAANAYGQQFDAAWTANADPTAFRMMAAHNIGDDEDFKKTAAKANAETLRHYKNLKTLINGDIPQ